MYPQTSYSLFSLDKEPSLAEESLFLANPRSLVDWEGPSGGYLPFNMWSKQDNLNFSILILKHNNNHEKMKLFIPDKTLEQIKEHANQFYLNLHKTVFTLFEFYEKKELENEKELLLFFIYQHLTYS
jgi:hypothetical protein